MPRRATPATSFGRSSQKLNIDLFKVAGNADEVSRFGRALMSALDCPGRERYRLVVGEPLALFHLHRNQGLVEGEIGRVRMLDTPSITNQSCEISEIPLSDDQGIAERTAFLYDLERGVVIIHSKREAVSASRLAGYCDTYSSPAAPLFLLQPVLRADAAARYESIADFKKIEVKFAKAANTSLRNPDVTTRAFVRGFSALEASSATIIMSAQRTAGSHLTWDAVRQFISSCFLNRDRAVERLVVSGKNAGDERLVLDLFESRLREISTVPLIGRSLSYEQRRTAVSDAYFKNLNQLPDPL